MFNTYYSATATGAGAASEGKNKETNEEKILIKYHWSQLTELRRAILGTVFTGVGYAKTKEITLANESEKTRQKTNKNSKETTVEGKG